MAVGAQKNDSNKKHVAVIGDGAMTAGMAFEALSHAGHLKPNILVILNDNDMSISENIVLSKFILITTTQRERQKAAEKEVNVHYFVPFFATFSTYFDVISRIISVTGF